MTWISLTSLAFLVLHSIYIVLTVNRQQLEPFYTNESARTEM